MKTGYRLQEVIQEMLEPRFFVLVPLQFCFCFLFFLLRPLFSTFLSYRNACCSLCLRFLDLCSFYQSLFRNKSFMKI